MANERITDKSELLDSNDNDWLYIIDVSDITENESGTGKKIRKSVFLESVNQAIVDSVSDSTIVNGVTTSSSVPTTGNIHAIGIGPGTYTNWGGMVIPANNIGTLQRVNGVYSVSLTPLVIPASKMETWTAKSYFLGDQVNHLGKDWVSNAATLSTDVPGTSSKWVDRLTGYFGGSITSSETKSTSGKTIFDYLYSTGFYQTTFLNENNFLNGDLFDGLNGWTFMSYLDHALATQKVIEYPNPYNLKVLNTTLTLLSIGGNNSQKTAVKFNQEKTFTPGSKTDLRFSFLNKTDEGPLHIWNVYFYNEAGTTISTLSNITLVNTLISDGWYNRTSSTITIPALAAKYRIEMVTRTYEPLWYGVTGTREDYFTAFYAHFSTATPLWKNIYGDYITGFLKADSKFNAYLLEKYNANKYLSLVGKKVTTYGDSITHNGNWQPAIVTASGIIHTKRGAPGCTIIENGTQAYFNADGSWAADGTGGATLKYQSMCNQNRVDTIPLDTQVLIIMAGTNDFSQNAAIGTINDVASSTFYGAYFDMLYKIFQRIPNAEIILATPVHKQFEETPNNDSKVMEDYRDAIRKTAFRLKYRLVDMSLTSINRFSILKYTDDGIHPNTLGAARMVKPFLDVLNTIY